MVVVVDDVDDVLDGVAGRVHAAASSARPHTAMRTDVICVIVQTETRVIRGAALVSQTFHNRSSVKISCVPLILPAPTRA